MVVPLTRYLTFLALCPALATNGVVSSMPSPAKMERRELLLGADARGCHSILNDFVVLVALSAHP